MAKEKRVKRALEYALIQTLYVTARTLPRRPGRKWFGALGARAYRWFPKDRERSIENLAIAFPQSPTMVRQAMTRSMFRALGEHAFDFLKLEGSSREQIDAMVSQVDGIEHIDAAFAEGKGLIAVTGHIGCWELMPAYFGQRGYPVTVVARKMRNPRLDKALQRIRRSVGVETIDRDANAREMLRVLRSKRALGVLIDQHTDVAGLYVPFFGRLAHTPSGVAKIALSTGAPIVPMAIFGTNDGKYRVQVLPPIPVPENVGNKDSAVREITTACSQAIETLIRTAPKQWVWFHNRWRGLPEERRESQAHVAN